MTHWIFTCMRRFLVITLAFFLFCGNFPIQTAIALQGNQSSIKPYLDRVVKQLTEFTLDNGLKFIVLERHQAPVVSFLTYANVGVIS